METFDYRLAWLVYVVVGIALSIIFWRLFKKYLWRELAYFLQAFMVAIVFTPWYVISDQDGLAPAFIVFAMDSFTIDSQAGVRGLIPLVMALMVAVVVGLVLSIIYRIKMRKVKKSENEKGRRLREKARTDNPGIKTASPPSKKIDKKKIVRKSATKPSTSTTNASKAAVSKPTVTKATKTAKAKPTGVKSVTTKKLKPKSAKPTGTRNAAAKKATTKPSKDSIRFVKKED